MLDDQHLGVGGPVSAPHSSNWGQDAHFGQLHAVIISLITTVGADVLFQFQQKNLSLFDEHGSIMRAVFVMFFLYVMGFMAEFKLHNQSHSFAIMKQFTPLFGLLAVVLLLFILSLSLGLAASIIWAFLVTGPTIRLFQEIIQRLRGIILPLCTNQRETSDMEESDPLGSPDNSLPV